MVVFSHGGPQSRGKYQISAPHVVLQQSEIAEDLYCVRRITLL